MFLERTCRLSWLIGLATLLPQHLAAQNRTTSDATELLLAGEQTVVTASRKVQRASEVPAAVTVITDEDIRTMGATSLLDVLRYVPGMEVSEFTRSLANVAVRGFNDFNSNKLLVMVDGRSIYQDYAGTVLWQNEPILLSRIKRIEVVRGPGSALYGANAFSGVVNIITKSPRELANATSKTTVRAIVGSQGTTYNEYLAGIPTTSPWDFAFGAAFNRTDGFGERKPGAVRDSFTTPSLTLDAQRRVKRGSLLFSASNAEATSDYLILPDSRFHISSLSATYQEENVKDPLMVRLYGNFTLFTSPGSRLVDARTLDVELQQQRTLSKQHNLVYGANYRRTRISAVLTGNLSRQQELFGGYLQDDIRISRFTHLFAGIRLDQNSLYGFNLTPRLSLIHNLAKDQAIRLSYGTSFRNPSLLDNFLQTSVPIIPGVDQVLRGSLGIEPERIQGYELGYRKTLKNGFVALNAFYNSLSGRIAFAPTAFAPPNLGLPPFTPTELTTTNLGDGTVWGFELESDMRFNKQHRMIFNYAFQNVTGFNASSRLLAPSHKINAGWQANWNSRLSSFLGVNFVGATSALEGNSLSKLPGYTRVNARVGYRFGTAAHPITLSLAATNLFDTKHSEYVQSPVSPVSEQRRTVYLLFEGKF